MTEYKVLKYSQEYKEQWDTFVDLAKNATFLFKRDFMEYHKDRFEDFSLLAFDKNNNLIAILPANIKDDTVYSHQGLTYGGIAILNPLKFTDYVRVFQEILYFLKCKNISSITIKELPWIYSSNKSDYFKSLVNILEGEIIRSEISLAVDLSNRIGFSSSKRQSISMSKKNNLTIKESDSCSEFWNEILIPNLWRKFKEKPVHTLEEISMLKNKFPKDIRQFNVYKEEKIIAGVTIFASNGVAHSQYSSGKHEFNSLRGLDYLLDYFINDCFTEKAHFSFGTSTSNKKSQINRGLFTWKQGFGSSPISQNIYKFKTQNFEKLNSLFS
jgi:hypothetical protein